MVRVRENKNVVLLKLREEEVIVNSVKCFLEIKIRNDLLCLVI